VRVRRIALGLTGASGARYGLRVLQELLRVPGTEVHLSISPAAGEVLRIEEDVTVDLERFDPRALGVKPTRRLIYHPSGNLAAPIASGSFPLEAMAIVPCSMKTLSGIANGYANNLVERAADVTIKEGRPLLLSPREMPFSAIHLENMLKLAMLGVKIAPPVLGFYHKPKKIDDIIDFLAGKILDSMGIEHEIFKRWG